MPRLVKAEDFKKYYGDEYPAAVVTDGVRMPLIQERRFARIYQNQTVEQKVVCEVSRFMDGSAAIALSELECEWPVWTENERIDFCQACCWLREQPDFPAMLRFIMQHGGPNEWSAVAHSVSSSLPRAEAFDILVRALRTLDIGNTSNITQAIAHTKHPEAAATLRSHLGVTWAHSALWDNAEFLNWVAFDATTCIEHLIELGAERADFAPQVRQLSEHPCSHNRDSCRNFLSKHYSWLK